MLELLLRRERQAALLSDGSQADQLLSAEARHLAREFLDFRPSVPRGGKGRRPLLQYRGTVGKSEEPPGINGAGVCGRVLGCGGDGGSRHEWSNCNGAAGQKESAAR